MSNYHDESDFRGGNSEPVCKKDNNECNVYAPCGNKEENYTQKGGDCGCNVEVIVSCGDSKKREPCKTPVPECKDYHQKCDCRTKVIINCKDESYRPF